MIIYEWMVLKNRWGRIWLKLERFFIVEVWLSDKIKYKRFDIIIVVWIDDFVALKCYFSRERQCPSNSYAKHVLESTYIQGNRLKYDRSRLPILIFFPSLHPKES